MTEDEERQADEVHIAYMLGVEWGKKRSKAAWKGVHEGAVLALQERINELEAALKKAADRFDEIGQNDDAANAYAALEGRKE